MSPPPQNQTAAPPEANNPDGLMALSYFTADCFRFAVELGVYGFALLPAGIVFVLLWRLEHIVWQVLAFPAGYICFILGFYLALLCLRLIFLRKIMPGEYSLKNRLALRWIVADSLMRLEERSFLRGYIKDFAIQRYLFFRTLGAKIDHSFLIGWDVKILDPWLLEVGAGTIIGSFAVISGHLVHGNTVTLIPVKIGDRVTIGMRAIIMPGVNIGHDAVVGAGAVVTKGTNIPPGEIWAGVPARKIGEVNPR